MYRSFYGLEKKPFQINSDPTFMWQGEKHKEALATLRYGILDNKGFLLLTGDVGTGKTTLINALIQSLGKDIICTAVPDPGLEKLDFFNYIGAAFGLGREFSSKGAFLAHFRQFLIRANEAGKKVLLIIDESQLLTQELLEEIRLLSNIEKTDTKLINIFFIGQNEFNEILNRQQNRAVRQRLTLNYNIDPLTPEETTEYIKYRLKIAGTTDPVFDRNAMHEVFLYSGGFPRRINVICDHCLLTGYVKEQKTITPDIVKECAKDLNIPQRVRNLDIDGYQKQPAPAPVSQEPQAPLPPPAPSAPMPVNEEKKKGSQIFWATLIAVLFFLFTWFFMFPEHFADSMRVFKDRFSYAEPAMDPALEQTMEQTMEPGDDFVKKIPERRPSGIVEPRSIKKTTEETASLDADQTALTASPGSSEKSEKQMNHLNRPDQPLNQLKAEPDHKILPIQEPVGHENAHQAGKKMSTINTLPDESSPMDQPEVMSKVLPLPDEKIIVRFKYNTNNFTPNGYEKLVDFANILLTHPETKILISGYTDKAGTKAYNQKLSEFRANIIKSFFLGKGIRPEQIEVIGKGSENPVESNDSAWGRMMNRRVEIQVIQS